MSRNPASLKANSQKTASAHPPQDRGSQWLNWWTLLSCCLVTFRPVTAEDFWWQLSRGRAVVAGSWWPSRQLLVHETLPDADWLGGVPSYVLYLFFDLPGVALLPVIGGIAWGLFLFFRLRGASLLPALLGIGVAWGMRDGLQTPSAAADLLGMLAAFLVVTSKWGRFQRSAAMLLVAVCWANFGQGVSWLLLWVPLLGITTGLPVREWIPSGIAAFLGACTTPRGVGTLVDSLTTTMPWLFYSWNILEASEWLPLWASTPSSPVVIFGMLWCVVAVWLTSHRRHLAGGGVWAGWTLWLSLGIMALLNLRMLPLCTIGLGCYAWWYFRHVEMGWSGWGASRRRLGVMLGVTGLILLDAGGAFSPDGEGLGWGLHPLLDDRPLHAGYPEIDASETVWTASNNGAGIYSWFRADGGRCLDAPARALIGGRLVEMLALRDDLRANRAARYLRSDGKWGGWWGALQQDRVAALFVPAEDLLTHEGLQGTRWKPLVFDGFSVPYVSAGEARFAQRQIEVLQQLDFVDTGPWQFDLHQLAPRDRYRVFSLYWGNSCDGTVALRLAGCLRSLGYPEGAQRVVWACYSTSARRLWRAELLACQQALALHEIRVSGEVSLLRREVLKRLSPAVRNDDSWPMDPLPTGDVPAAITAAIPSYLSGDLMTAESTLSMDQPDVQLAKGLVLIDLGRPRDSLNTLRSVLNSKASDSTSLLATDWYDRLLRWEEVFNSN